MNRKKLKEKWGYSKHQVDVFWQVHKDKSADELKIELERI